MVNDRTLVPIRGIFESLGAEVLWDEPSQTATGSLGGKTVSLAIGSTTANVNGVETTLDVPAQLINDRTMVPVRFIAEGLGANVVWQEASQTVVIEKHDVIRRDVPKSTISNSSSMEDLVYFGSEQDVAQKLAALPQGEVALNNDNLLNTSAATLGEYATMERVPVSDMPFSEALRIDVKTLPPSPYASQLAMNIPTPFEEGDVVLLTMYFRTVKGGLAETQAGEIQCIMEQNGGDFAKIIQGGMTAGNEWKVGYFPCVITNEFTGSLHVTIRLGYHVQTVEIGGFSLVNYGKDVTIDDMPKDTAYTGSEKDAQWRKDAIARIEQIRKGDINVVVQDANGNPIPDADVDVSMFEHEFQFGTAVYNSVLEDSNQRYREEIGRLFNSAVFEVEHKWNFYESNPGLARQMTDLLMQMGVHNIRGHIWIPATEKEYTEGNTQFPKDFTEMYDDKDALYQRVKGHIDHMGSEFYGELCQWDVLNELADKHSLADKYGPEYYKNVYDWARAADPTTKLYVTEGAISILPSDRYDIFTDILDTFVETGVDFDGIGIQGHIGTPNSPAGWYDLLDGLAKKYQKEVTVTEYDFDAQDEDLQGNYTRDILLASFSCEAVQGFYMWGFWDGAHWLTNAPVYTKDWTLKKSGQQYIDLVYNKWWTQEAGKTGADGTYSVRGYYGDYDITATANGKSKTVVANCYKGQDNTIVIVLD